jgi:hypothetical protein
MSAQLVVCIDSFVDAVDSVRTAGGKLYHFEFHEMFGPTLTDANGNVLKVQPMSPNHPFWKPFNVWLLQRIRLQHTQPRGMA